MNGNEIRRAIINNNQDKQVLQTENKIIINNNNKDEKALQTEDKQQKIFKFFRKEKEKLKLNIDSEIKNDACSLIETRKTEDIKNGSKKAFMQKGYYILKIKETG